MRHVRMAKVGPRYGSVLLTELRDDWDNTPDFVGNILDQQQSAILSDLIGDLNFCASLKLFAQPVWHFFFVGMGAQFSSLFELSANVFPYNAISFTYT